MVVLVGSGRMGVHSRQGQQAHGQQHGVDGDVHEKSLKVV
jgi:hypothetical protein